MDNKEKIIRETFEWPPLESDPEIFNQYFHKIGLPDNVTFDELWSLDYKEVQPIDEPVIGVICAIRRPKGRFFYEDQIIDHKNIPFFMKQQGSLDNACGLVATLHCFGNNEDSINLNDNSILGNFFKRSKEKSPEEICKVLENDIKFKEVHYSSSQQGQSSIPNTQESIYCHYIVYVNHQDKVLELDGTLPGPMIVKTESHKNNLLDDAIEELKKRINLGLFGDNLSVIIVKLA